ncbi:response regulator transcription factor [Siccationidurans ginsengisoli]|uniref:LytR/AlgR family response regulator transcription factor n=1 Tax=Hymenobacter TaxID=89966 RepID=UPI001AADC932|nr:MULTISPECIES: LytTR family DNA-binding domain-containing protein [unclassified Hymenobacter]MBO2031596.1 response regulator transcription factor [Hymenobacter sp. BT559]
MSSSANAAAPLAQLACVVVDDNEMNRLTLEHYVGMTAGLTLAGTFADGVACLNYFRKGGKADILLLDINMPELTGLDLVRILPEPLPDVVLVTSHRDYAVDAFELRVTDYLVKPLDYARFSRTVDRIRSQRAALAAASPTGGAEAMFDADGSSLFLKINNRLMRVNFDEVLYIEAMSMYSVLVTLKHKHIVYATLKTFEERLPFAHFVRVHRSYMVNTQLIEAVEDNQLQLPGGHEVPVAKAYQDSFFKRLRGI